MEKNCLARQHWAHKEYQNIDVVKLKFQSQFDLTPGCGGLRRPVEEFKVRGFIESFISAIMLRKRNFLKESTWMIGGDGRYYFKEAFLRVIAVMAGYKVGNIVTAKGGILTTPAMCLMVQKIGAMGGIMLTAGHTPAGPQGYFGIKYVVEDGSTASDSLLKDIQDIGQSLTTCNYATGVEFPLDDLMSYNFGIEEHILSVTVKDAVRIYADYLKTIFDYGKIRELLTGDEIVSIPVRIIVDCMDGACGPYACEVFEYDLGAAPGTVINKVPKESYVTGFPSPRNSKGLVQGLRTGTQEVGFALDADGDRVMVMGKSAYHVYSSDSIAVLAEHLHCIPYFQVKGIAGYARSYPTSVALDRVAKKTNTPLHEVPGGWIYFCNLIKTNAISFCGDINYGVVYDNVDRKSFYALIDFMEFTTNHEQFIASQYGRKPFIYTVLTSRVFKYTDPVDNITHKTGIVVSFHPSSRIIYRMGLGNKVNRFRIYLEAYSNDPSDFDSAPVAFLTPLSKLATQYIANFLKNTRPQFML